ncbi:Methyltransferase domain-containing protein [Salegentibacter holothuriorum]|uniref:Methyltransferase domain-containing protein n=1 Tax=Salegentibacter holothuriorum TaxID=241145 RepID=A0A1T5CKN6_9FLAO|nr:class I SAM-dependent methyltransferase [Salegentibacter holothuriorum]SKB60075.1 Methyltransferase domain-containing protein [Salegentibacter holothuriorum]
MFRVELIQNYINDNAYSRYLEIGTFKGGSLFPIKCKKKIAVDPHFLFSKKRKLYWIARNNCNIWNSYYEMSSIDFFTLKKKRFLDNKIDIAFIDGLHTFKASLKDTLNTLSILKEGGTIILHDCLPPHEAAAAPAESYEDAYKKRDNKWTGQWCGDVWKTIVYLKQKYPNSLDVFTVDEDYGLGVVKPLDSKMDLEIDFNLFQEINTKDFQFLKKDYKNILNLKPKDFR